MGYVNMRGAADCGGLKVSGHYYRKRLKFDFRRFEFAAVAERVVALSNNSLFLDQTKRIALMVEEDLTHNTFSMVPPAPEYNPVKQGIARAEELGEKAIATTLG